MNIFVSYSRSDAAFAKELARVLRGIGLSLWIDQDDIPAGARWDSAIEQALRECQSLLVLLSPASVKSHNVLDEIGFAIDEGKTVLPVVISPCSVPLRVRRHQRIAYSGDMRALAQAIAVGNPAALAAGNSAASASSRKGELTRLSAISERARLKGGIAQQAATVAKPTRVSESKKALVPRTVGNVIRQRNRKSSELKAVDVALSEIPATMPGERKRLEIQRDKFAVQLATLQAELDEQLNAPSSPGASNA